MFTTFSTLLLAGVLAAPAHPPIITVSTTTNEYAKERVMEEFKEIPALLDVAACESTFRQFEGTSTTPLKGIVVPADRGIMQINEDYHKKAAESMGIDIYTVDGNIAYAKVLYLKNGLRDWKSSWKCMEARAKQRNKDV